ncbi:MAG: hypothetical protein K2P68_10225, partial [Sphingomonas sp.]|nr:hypothetical protein [Sphingomonas sp.]
MLSKSRHCDAQGSSRIARLMACSKQQIDFIRVFLGPDMLWTASFVTGARNWVPKQVMPMKIIATHEKNLQMRDGAVLQDEGFQTFTHPPALQ